MTKNTRKKYQPEEKVSILRKHLLEGESVSDACDAYEVNPTVFYRWQQEFFEQGRWHSTGRGRMPLRARNAKPVNGRRNCRRRIT